MKYSYSERLRVINSGLPTQLKKVSKQLYLHSRERIDGELYRNKVNSFDECLAELHSLESSPDFDCAVKINRSYKDRQMRLRKRLSYMMECGSCLFLTLTFDRFYITLDYKTLRQYIRQYLNSLNCLYVANADYGSKNGRLHFHAVVQLDSIIFDSYKYGNIDFRRIYLSDDSCKRLSHYLVKLSNHSIKNSTRFSSIMYSRFFKSF